MLLPSMTKTTRFSTRVPQGYIPDSHKGAFRKVYSGYLVLGAPRDKSIGDLRTLKSACPAKIKAIYLPRQIIARHIKNASFGLSRGALKSGCPLYNYTLWAPGYIPEYDQNNLIYGNLVLHNKYPAKRNLGILGFVVVNTGV